MCGLCAGSRRARSLSTLPTGLEGARVSAAGVSVPCRWPFFPLPASSFFNKVKKNKWKAKLAEVFKYFILVSNVNSYIGIAVLGVFRLHVTFCNIFVNHSVFVVCFFFLPCIQSALNVFAELLVSFSLGDLVGSPASAAPSSHRHLLPRPQWSGVCRSGLPGASMGEKGIFLSQKSSAKQPVQGPTGCRILPEHPLAKPLEPGQPRLPDSRGFLRCLDLPGWGMLTRGSEDTAGQLRDGNLILRCGKEGPG